MVGHVAPEAALGGPIALVEDGDILTVDVASRRLDLAVDPEVLAARRTRWVEPAARYTGGVMAKYWMLVGTAAAGALTAPAARRRS
jgi:dihydroxy-acid dehydratase